MQFLMAIDVKNTGVELFNFRFGIPCLREAASAKAGAIHNPNSEGNTLVEKLGLM